MKSTIIFVRTMLIIALPFMLIYSVGRELITGFWQTLRYAYLEVRIGIEDFQHAWQDTPDQVRADRTKRGLTT